MISAFESEGILASSLDDLFAGRPVAVTPAPAGRHQLQLPLGNQLVSLAPLAAGGR